MPEHCVRRSDAIVAGQRKIHASAHAIAVDGRGDGHREAVEHLHKLLAASRKSKGIRAAELGDFIQVRSGRKELFIAGDDQAFKKPLFRFSAQLLDHREQGMDAGERKNVCAVNGGQANNSAIVFAH